MSIAIVATGGTIATDGTNTKNDFLSELDKEIEIFNFSEIPSASIDADYLKRLSDFVSKVRDSHEGVVITHGTDSMVETATVLMDIPHKTIVLTGALNPARFRDSDAIFNIGCAVGAVQSLPPGVYIAMNGKIWDPEQVRKNRRENRFEPM